MSAQEIPQDLKYAAIQHLLDHMENSACQPTDNEKRIEIVAGEVFPPCLHCKNDAFRAIIL